MKYIPLPSHNKGYIKAPTISKKDAVKLKIDTFLADMEVSFKTLLAKTSLLFY